MSDYEITNFELRVLLRHYWRNNFDAKAAAKAICDVESEGMVAPRTTQKWFKRFNEGDFGLEDKPRSGRPTVSDEQHLQATLSHSMKLKKHVKNFSIPSRRNGTLTKFESLQIVGRRSLTMMVSILKNSCCCF